MFHCLYFCVHNLFNVIILKYVLFIILKSTINILAIVIAKLNPKLNKLILMGKILQIKTMLGNRNNA